MLMESPKLCGRNPRVLLCDINPQSFCSLPTKYISSVNLVWELFPGLLQYHIFCGNPLGHYHVAVSGQCTAVTYNYGIVTYLGCVRYCVFTKLYRLIKCNESIKFNSVRSYRKLKPVTTKRFQNKTKQNKKAPQHLYRHYAQISNFPLQKKWG